MRKRLTLPNVLTLIRLIGLPLWCLFYFRLPIAVSLPLLIFLFATDFLDGWLARRTGQESHFGAIFDPITDRLTTCFLYAWLAVTGFDSPWLASVVALRHVSQALSVPILIGWLGLTFTVKARAFPRWVTFFNSCYFIYVLYLVPFIDSTIEPQLRLGLAIPMALAELWIFLTYIRRAVQIAQGTANEFN